jgi:hypothetical protein
LGVQRRGEKEGDEGQGEFTHRAPLLTWLAYPGLDQSLAWQVALARREGGTPLYCPRVNILQS